MPINSNEHSCQAAARDRPHHRPSTAPDGGWGWVVVVAAFGALFVNAGFVQTIGVYQVEWQDYFSASAGTVALIVAEFSIFNNACGLLAGALCKRYGCRKVLILAGVISFTALFLASFATKLWHAYIFSFLAGVGFGLSYPPAIVISSFYFKKRLGIANGIVNSGIGVGVLCMAPLLQLLSSQYGWKGAILIHSAISANLIVCGALFRPSGLERRIVDASRRSRIVNPREECIEDDLSCHEVINVKSKSDDRPIRRWLTRVALILSNFFDLSIYRNCRYVVFMVSVIISSFTIVAYINYLMSRMVYDLNFSKMESSLVMTFLGICNTAARLLQGILLDARLISSVNLFTLSLACLATATILNPLAGTYAQQATLAGLFGLGIGVFYPLLALLATEFVGLQKLSNAFGMLIGVAGIGALLGILMMGFLYDATGSYTIPFFITGAAEFVAVLMMVLLSTYSRRLRDENSNETGNGCDDVKTSASLVDPKNRTNGYGKVPTTDCSELTTLSDV
ncbi:monocarboxylate transporter 13-like [Diadema setosum]|uniref:monocarboxylate transporter 13-like n=1 Tax=Diadema setosum TaxID=31175 RepID=UPI003B3A03FC